jgi:peptidoglycan/xylan/chitin deacetylase (PgdA/CDA1 family)
MALCLMYHNVVADDAERRRFAPAHRPYVVTTAAFHAHLAAAKESGMHFVSPGELGTGAAADSGALLLTFDDSWDNRLALDVMDEHGVAGIFFLTSGELGGAGRMTKLDAAETVRRGHEVGSHGVRHLFLSRLGIDALKSELALSKRDLEDATGCPVRFLSAPGGLWSRSVAAEAKRAGYEKLFTSRPGFLKGYGETFALNRLAVTADMDDEAFRGMLKRPRLYVAARLSAYAASRVAGVFRSVDGSLGHKEGDFASEGS